MKINNEWIWILQPMKVLPTLYCHICISSVYCHDVGHCALFLVFIFWFLWICLWLHVNCSLILRLCCYVDFERLRQIKVFLILILISLNIENRGKFHEPSILVIWVITYSRKKNLQLLQDYFLPHLEIANKIKVKG